MALLAIAHCVGIVMGVASMVFVEWLIPTGHEGGWLTRIYVGALFAATVLINLILLIGALFKIGISAPAVALRIVAVAAPILLGVWRLLARG